MEWLQLTKEKSSEAFAEFCSSHTIDCPDSYKPIQKDIQDLFVSTLSELNIDSLQISQNAYKVDYLFGLKLYQLLNNRYNMTVRMAATEGIWLFLSVKVVPDLIELRYGIDHPDRFWKKPKRLWLRVLWWYIHLSWQGDYESTKEALKDNTTDEILQLVDRCGRDGYRVDFCRELMKKFSKLNPEQRKQTKIFRKMMVLNTAKVQTIEPSLVDGGESAYVNDLCEYFGYTWK